MHSHNYSDSISTLNLSTRSYNTLRREGIHTTNDLLNCSKDDIINFRSVGVKSLEEIVNAIDSLNKYKLEMYSENMLNKKRNHKTFVGHDGLKYIDIAIENLNLSVRAFNCLKSTSVDYYSQLIDVLDEELIAIPNMGRKTLLELEHIKKTVQPTKYVEDNKGPQTDIEDIGCKIFASISEKINIKPKKLFEIFKQVYSNYIIEKDVTLDIKDILKDKIFMKTLYENEYMKSVINDYVLNIIRENNYGCDENYLFDRIPYCFKFREIMNESLNDLLIRNDIDLLYDDRFVAIYNSFVIGAKDYLNDKEYDVIWQRIQGKTLVDVGKTKDVSKQRIRQIEEKAIKKLNNASIKFKEDVYSDIFNRYIILKEDFKIAFNDDEAYQYLVIRYHTTSEKDRLLKKPLENILHDKDIPMFFKRACEKAIYKNYVKIGNEYIPCSRNSISKYVLKNFGSNDLNFVEYSDIYFSILKDIDKINDPKLEVMERGYENKLAASNIVLWKYGKKFRYYNIDSYDFTDLLSRLNINQYKNVEYSTLKFFRLLPELMKVYDIRDEYELHNLLKKICSSDEYPTVNFKRMPNIEFGNADRDNQVLELLITLAPISNSDFAKEYENEYGVAANTVLANYMGNFDQYFYNGVYKIDFPALPNIIAQRLKQILIEDFYMLSTIREIYQKEFPQADKKLLNPFSLKSIGFKVYSNYAVSDIYSSASEYFNMLFTKTDITDLVRIASSVKEIISYTSQLYKLKSDYEIIEFMPNKIIHFRKLKEFGITKEMLNEYRNDVLNFVGDGKYFTLFSLRNEGFTHELDDLGFDDWFYTSILIEDKSNISYQRIGGNKVMLSGNFNIRFEEFLEYIVFSQESLSIDIHDLSDIFKQQYNVNVNTRKLIDIVRYSSLYYDAISEKIFADYDTYYEVV
ncbi:RNA polymerase, alpha subunit domain protein [Alkaliphilus metalliredigens QYMF]|uniref:RNA polymerase, alpha subunit domain protein n=1 Tax=Alkaliphilus metalliredigens (strain QYMF) TaxID=293826 RepID=A6TQ35_ALKMQ|nr:DNA-directed RNA polymerase subunit alpha C-terminal domain-containing protein [Alkaliphilus metalliredigens]ABR48303.1 RNA polymerase, alpha subunit domain protein [Alkaliphilus metalliredigens QYMF]